MFHCYDYIMHVLCLQVCGSFRCCIHSHRQQTDASDGGGKLHGGCSELLDCTVAQHSSQPRHFWWLDMQLRGTWHFAAVPLRNVSRFHQGWGSSVQSLGFGCEKSRKTGTLSWRQIQLGALSWIQILSPWFAAIKTHWLTADIVMAQLLFVHYHRGIVGVLRVHLNILIGRIIYSWTDVYGAGSHCCSLLMMT